MEVVQYGVGRARGASTTTYSMGEGTYIQERSRL